MSGNVHNRTRESFPVATMMHYQHYINVTGALPTFNVIGVVYQVRCFASAWSGWASL